MEFDPPFLVCNGFLHSSVKRNLLGWHGAFVGKRREKAWRPTPLCLIWIL